ncbi:ribonuclease activity regulator protein RraA [Vibrio chagasii]|uniref:Ribonuclease activity regulator protein RraA n=1 Tax=Vibrio chagasii TaxID=170679 RepID=A0A7Y4DQS5_9VIBR|nr:ribonuclease activity regulator protein RraA [Vibrio chagasii]
MLLLKIIPLFSLFYAQSNTELGLIEHIYLLESKDSFRLPWFIISSLADEM